MSVNHSVCKFCLNSNIIDILRFIDQFSEVEIKGIYEKKMWLGIGLSSKYTYFKSHQIV